LIFVIESKLGEGIDPGQAEKIPLGPLAGRCQLQEEGVLIRWHDLLAAWQDLSELGLLTYSERNLLEDFFDMAKQSFGRLLPFDTLVRAAGNEERIRLRLRDVLEESSRIEASSTAYGWKAVGSWRTFESFFLGMQHQQNRLVLSAWPGFKKNEAQNLYSEPELLKSLTDVNDTALRSAHVDVYPIFSVTNYVPRADQWFKTEFDGTDDYIRFWRENTDAIRRRGADELKGLFDWLVQHRLANREKDWPEYEETFISRRLSMVDIHPALEIDAIWSLADATALDSKGQLVDEVRAAMNAVLEALGEEQLEPADGAKSLS
jgi:hypothetical protein